MHCENYLCSLMLFLLLLYSKLNTVNERIDGYNILDSFCLSSTQKYKNKNNFITSIFYVHDSICFSMVIAQSDLLSILIFFYPHERMQQRILGREVKERERERGRIVCMCVCVCVCVFVCVRVCACVCVLEREEEKETVIS